MILLHLQNMEHVKVVRTYADYLRVLYYHMLSMHSNIAFRVYNI